MSAWKKEACLRREWPLNRLVLKSPYPFLIPRWRLARGHFRI